MPPVHKPLYKMSPLELDKAKKQIKDMLEYGFIGPWDSSYGALVLYVPKKGWEPSVLYRVPLAQQENG